MEEERDKETETEPHYVQLPTCIKITGLLYSISNIDIVLSQVMTLDIVLSQVMTS